MKKGTWPKATAEQVKRVLELPLVLFVGDDDSEERDVSKPLPGGQFRAPRGHVTRWRI
jgi:hypothetical protein